MWLPGQSKHQGPKVNRSWCSAQLPGPLNIPGMDPPWIVHVKWCQMGKKMKTTCFSCPGCWGGHAANGRNGNVWIIWIPHSFVNISPRLLAALVIMVSPLFCQTSQRKLEPIMWHHSNFRGSDYVAFIALMLAYILYACISLYIYIVFAWHVLLYYMLYGGGAPSQYIILPIRCYRSCTKITGLCCINLEKKEDIKL